VLRKAPGRATTLPNAGQRAQNRQTRGRAAGQIWGLRALARPQINLSPAESGLANQSGDRALQDQHNRTENTRLYV